MKTLEQIIRRSDYKRLSKELANKAEELAELIIAKMKELDINELKDLVLTKRSSSGYSQTYLCIYYKNKCEYSGALNACKKSDAGGNRTGFYYAGDFSEWIDFAGNDDVLHFINFFQSYLQKIDEIETEKCTQIEDIIRKI